MELPNRKETVMTNQDETEVNDCITMGGTANLFTVTEKRVLAF